MNPVMNQYKMSSPAERARLRVVYALLGTVFFMPRYAWPWPSSLPSSAAGNTDSARRRPFPCSCRRQAFSFRPCCPSSARLTG